MKIAPEVFRLNADSKAQPGDPTAAPDEVVLKAARCCPYRAVTVIDAETGAQLIPRSQGEDVILAARMTGSHLATSLTMNALASSGLPPLA